MNTWLQDVGFGIRILKKNLAFSIVAILVIALVAELKSHLGRLLKETEKEPAVLSSSNPCIL